MPARIVKRSGEIDIEGWSFQTIEDLRDQLSKIVERAVRDTIQAAMESDSTFAGMPATWSDEAGIGDGCSVGEEDDRFVDPLTVSLTIGLDNDGNGVTYFFDIREDIEQAIETTKEDGSYAPGLRRIMVAFRELADQIEEALPK